MNDDTIIAPATAAGGAIAVIRISGSDALAISDRIFTSSAKGSSLSSSRGYTMHYGHIADSDGTIVDDVVASVFRAPASYTGEDSVEISCHGSSYVIGKIMELMVASGARMATPGEFTQRAFVNGKMDLAQAEAVADLIAAETESAHRVAMAQLKGGFSNELSQMRDSLLRIASLMELELDFSEEEVEFADRSELAGLLDDSIGHIGRLVDSFRLGNAIKNGIPVAIAGSTNSGKSTLLNALLGEERAIVSNIAGTTRDTIEERINLGGILFRFIDTAGLRKTDEEIERIGIERSFQAISKASIVIGTVDGTIPHREFVEAAKGLISTISEGGPQKLILVRTKIDLLESEPIGCDLASAAGTGGCSADLLDGSEPIGCDLASAAGTGGCSARELAAEIGIERIIDISAPAGLGLDKLRAAIIEAAGLDYTAATNATSTLVSNSRHLESLKNAGESLSRVRSGLATSLPTDLLAQDLREALYHLGTITGAITTDEVLGNIFRNFCIGK